MEERSTETIRNAYKGNVKHGKSEAIAPKWVLQSTEAVMQYYLDRDLTLDRCVLEKFPLPQEGHGRGNGLNTLRTFFNSSPVWQ